jgi:DeoR/GlpR family transcriptional regulator of sugar metabolism
MSKEAVDTKRRMAVAVAEVIGGDGEAVGLDSGTSVVEVAHALVGRRLTVMPMSLHAAMALAASSSVRLMMPGGETRPVSWSMAGHTASSGA